MLKNIPRGLLVLIVMAAVILPLGLMSQVSTAQSCSRLSRIYVSPGNLQGYDFSQTRATGHYEFTETGLRVYTESNTSTDKVAGYMPLDMPLASVTQYLLTKTGTTGTIPPAGQLVVDANGDSIPDGILVYEPDFYEADHWWSNYNFGAGSGMGYNTYATLAEIVAVHPNARVLATGFSLGSGVFGDWTIQSIQVNCNVYVFDLTPPPTVQLCPDTTTVRVTPPNQGGWTFAETRATGHYEFTSTGLHIYTEGATSTDKVAGYLAVDFPLWQVGAFELAYTPTSGGRPGGNLRIDLNGDDTYDATLVYEPEAYGAGNWWSNANLGIGSGMGYNSFGTLNEVLEQYPTAQVLQIGFSLGSGVLGEGMLGGITAGCTTYVFGLEQVTATEPVVDTIDACGQYGSVTLPEIQGVLYNALPANAREGMVTVSAAAEPGYELLDYTGPWSYNLGAYTECPPGQVTAPAPTFVEPTRTTEARVVLPVHPMIDYTLDGVPGTGATVTVTATLKPGVTGYVLVGKTSWTHTFDNTRWWYLPLMFR